MVRRRTFRVEPAPTGWAVFKSGARADTVDTKREALSAAKVMARSGDQIEIKRADGTFQETRTVR